MGLEPMTLFLEWEGADKSGPARLRSTKGDSRNAETRVRQAAHKMNKAGSRPPLTKVVSPARAP